MHNRSLLHVGGGIGLLVMASTVHAQAIVNPLGNVTLVDILINTTQFLLGLVAILALLALVVGGIRMIAAFGNEDAVRSAKKIIFWAIAGLAVVMLSYFVIQLVGQILGGTF